MPSKRQQQQWLTLITRNKPLVSLLDRIESGEAGLSLETAAKAKELVQNLIDLEIHFNSAPNEQIADDILQTAKEIVKDPSFRRAQKSSSAAMMAEFISHCDLAAEGGPHVEVELSDTGGTVLDLMQRADREFWSENYHGRGSAVARALMMEQFPGFEAVLTVRVGLTEHEQGSLVGLANSCLQLLVEPGNEGLMTAACQQVKALRSAIVKAKNEAYADAPSADDEPDLGSSLGARK